MNKKTLGLLALALAVSLLLPRLMPKKTAPVLPVATTETATPATVSTATPKVAEQTDVTAPVETQVVNVKAVQTPASAQVAGKVYRMSGLSIKPVLSKN